jgi:hypothetical protein
LVRAVPVLALLPVLALAACKPAPGKGEQAAASGVPAAASSAPAAASSALAAPEHNWAYKQGDLYAYVSAAHADPAEGGEAEKPTMFRYLGMKDGTYVVAEVENGAVVVASCAPPCQEVRLRGQGLDQTLPLNPSSAVFAALTDAINGQLEPYKRPAR